MRILSRALFREIFTSAALGTVLFTFVLFLRTVEKLFSILVRSSAPPFTVGKLFLYALPATVPFTLPLGVLVGVLIALSRMSSDGEITAMRASGIPSTSLVRPVFLFSFLALCATAATSLWLSPLALQKQGEIAKKLLAEQLTAEIQPRVFEEEFPHTVLYVGDVVTGQAVIWKKVFLADISTAEELKEQGKERGSGPRITVAAEAIATPDVERNQIQLTMRDVRTYEIDKEGKYVSTSTPEETQILQAQKPADTRVNRAVAEMDTGDLYNRVYKTSNLTKQDLTDAGIELHQRFALPFACVLLAMVGIPLGASSRKGGKSMAFVVTVALAFLYYMGLITMIGLARKGNMPVSLAVWTPNAIFAVTGMILLLRLERPGDRDFVGWVRNLARSLTGWIKTNAPRIAESLPRLNALRRFGVRPQLIDGYVLNSFLFYFGVFLAALVLMTEVFTFFELLSDMVKNNIPMSEMLEYLFFLAPKLIYDATPISVLVASLICFGILTKHNEVTAFKASGISVHRLALPVLFASFCISVGLFAFDHYYVPDANRRQEALRSKIKGKPIQTYLRPDRQWIAGKDSRIYNYLYLDPSNHVMSRVNVYELDQSTFHIRHQISAEKARWEPDLEKWVFLHGWSRDNKGPGEYLDFQNSTASFDELTEPPDYFVKEVRQYKEMNFQALAKYIKDLKESGLDTIRLQVQYHKKFAVPLFALIMAVISIPFAFVAGNRGAMTGVGISFGIAIAYWSLNQLFEQVGDLNQLPAAMAAWSPDAIFSMAGLYFMIRMRT